MNTAPFGAVFFVKMRLFVPFPGVGLPENGWRYPVTGFRRPATAFGYSGTGSGILSQGAAIPEQGGDSPEQGGGILLRGAKNRRHDEVFYSELRCPARRVKMMRQDSGILSQGR